MKLCLSMIVSDEHTKNKWGRRQTTKDITADWIQPGHGHTQNEKLQRKLPMVSKRFTMTVIRNKLQTIVLLPGSAEATMGTLQKSTTQKTPHN